MVSSSVLLIVRKWVLQDAVKNSCTFPISTFRFPSTRFQFLVCDTAHPRQHSRAHNIWSGAGSGLRGLEYRMWETGLMRTVQKRGSGGSYGCTCRYHQGKYGQLFSAVMKGQGTYCFCKKADKTEKLLNKSCVFTLAFSVGIKIIAPGEDLSVPNICAWLLACFHFICVVARYIWSRISVLRTAMRNKALHRNRVVIAILKYKATEAKDVIETFVILSTSK